MEAHNSHSIKIELSKQAKHEHQPPTVVIRSHGKETELGSFLNKADKDALVKKLRKIIYH